MKLFLDTEFDGFKGPLLSMGIYSPQSYDFYEVIDRPVTHPWVKQHVAPFFERDPLSADDFTEALHEYLMAHNGCEIIADWPEDIMHLLSFCCGENGWMLNFNCTARLVTSGPLSPTIPHNALSDAQALGHWYMKAKAA